MLKAQYFSWGNEPQSIKWRQIKTDNFQVIYPSTHDSVAQRFTNLLEFVYDACGHSLGHAPAKISVVLHVNSTIANGSVAWAPKRMDIFDAPSQDIHSQDWLTQLAIHEFRHVVQTDKLNQGITNIIYFLLGEQGIGLVAGMYLPSWFLEGDAVATETALSNSGRGRQADFLKGLRAQFLEKGTYSYSKAYFGSYKHFVPDYYSMGYVLVGQTRLHYDNFIWDRVVTFAATHPLRITSFNQALKIETNMGKIDLYKTMMNKQLVQWKLDYEREIYKPYDTLTARNPKRFTNYRYPQRISDSYILAEKSGLADAPKIVKIDANGREQIFAHTSFKQSGEKFHTNSTQVVWCEVKPHPRWELKNYSTIYIKNAVDNSLSTIRTKKRLYAPNINRQGTKIVVVEIDNKSFYRLLVYDVATKKIVDSFLSPQQEFISSPAWNADGTKVVYIGLSDKGKRLVELSWEDKKLTELLAPTSDDIQNPIYWNDFVLYSSSYSGVDNIYALHIPTQEIHRVTVSAFGAKYPAVYNESLLFSDYTSDGYMVAQQSADPRAWHSIDAVKKYNYELARTLSYREQLPLDYAHIPDSVYESRRYSKLLNALNIHSWQPVYMDHDFARIYSLGMGFQIFSQNKLSSTEVVAGYRKNSSAVHSSFFAKIKYTGWYPKLSLQIEHGEYLAQEIAAPDTLRGYYSYNSLRGDVEVPFNFSSRSVYRSAQLKSQVLLTQYELQSQDIPEGKPENYFRPLIENATLMHSASLLMYRAVSPRDVALRLGFLVQSGFAHTIEKSPAPQSQYMIAEAAIFLPGLFRHHAIELYAGAEHYTDTTKLTMLSVIQHSRGGMLQTLKYSSATSTHINYTLPLCYPDLTLGTLLYVKRWYATAFVDYSWTTNRASSFTSVGVESVWQMHVLHHRYPISIKALAGYFEPKKTFFQFGFNLNL